MATAPRSAALFRVPRGKPLPSLGSPALLGAPLAPDELGPGWRFVVEIGFGAVLSNPSSTWTWSDVTSDVLQSDGRYINISLIGRQDENPRTPAAACSLTLDNRGNRYSKKNAYSPNWPNVRDNTPLRVRVTNDNGANWWVLFQGEVTVWQPSFDVTGNYAITDVSAKGRTQRLLQHTAPLRSAFERSISKDATYVPIGYWPFEDGSTATQAVSPIPGVQPMVENQDGGLLPQFAAISAGVVPGSDVLPNWDNGGDVWAPVAGGTAGTNGWTVDFVLFSGTIMSTDDISTVSVVTGATTPIGQNEGFNVTLNQSFSPPRWQVAYQKNVAGVFTSTPIITPSFASTVSPFDGNPHMMRLTAVQSGSNISVVFSSNGTQIGTASISTRTLRPVTAVEVGNLGFSYAVPLAIGHVGVWNGTNIPDHTSLMKGNVGENPVTRMTRLCSEEGIEFQQVGYYSSIVTMGSQGVDTLTNLMQECADAEDGMLYDGVSAGLTYQPPSQRYDQQVAITVDTAAHEMQLFQPLDDDLNRVNRATVNQKNGSTYVAEQASGPMGTGPNGMGDVDAQLTINVSNPQLAFYRANWEVWKGAGSDAGYRFPLIPLNIRAHSTLAAKWISRADGYPGPVVPGSRCDLMNLTSWAAQFPSATVPVVIEGYAIRLTKIMFEIDLLCTPNRRYDVIKVGDTRLGRVQTPGSSLAGDTAAGGTTLSVATQVGSVGWTTTGPFPLTVEVDGIQVTVNSIGAITTDSLGRLVQIFTVDGTTVTKALLTGVYVKMWHGGVVKF